MKMGVRSHDFGRMNEQLLAKTIKTFGFDCVQIAVTKAIENINSFGDVSFEKMQNIKKCFDDSNLEISVLGCYIEPSIKDTQKRLSNVEIFKTNLEYANKLNISLVGTETTHFYEDESKREDAYNLLKDSVLRFTEKAESENVFVGIEPVFDHTLNTPELTKRLFDEVNSKKLKVIFDPSNLLSPENINDQQLIFKTLFNELGAEIAAVHIKDFVIENNQKIRCTIGKGLIDYKFIFEWLKQNNPNLPIIIENTNINIYKEELQTLYNLIK